MFEEWLLDDQAALTRADGAGLLLDLASAGATVRRAVRLADEAGLDRLRPEGRPRAVLVAGHGTAVVAGELLAALGGTVCPVTVLAPSLTDPAHPSDRPGPHASASDLRSDFGLSLDWALPGWVGPSDLLLILSTEGTEPGLIALAELAYTRGCSVVSVAPAGSSLAGATLQVRGLPLPFGTAGGAEPVPGLERDLPRETPSALWGLLAPALAFADRVGIVSIPVSSLQSAADQLDDMAVRCGPAADTYSNPAKSLAIHLDGVLPLLWSDGPGTAAVSRRFAAMLSTEAARPALTGMLPDALTSQYGLLRGQLGGAEPDEDDFFRDRTEDSDALRYKIFLLRRIQQPVGSPTAAEPLLQPEPDTAPAPEPYPAPYAVARVHRLATDHRIGIQELTSALPDALGAITELVALTDFAAVYLGLASSSSPRVR